MSALVRTFEAKPPEHCLGLIWYRLPIGREQHNWDAQTWHAVMAGRIGSEAWQAQAQVVEDGLIEIVLVQSSEIAVEPPRQITASWASGTALAWDAQRHYSVRAKHDHALSWEWPSNMTPPLLSKGTQWTIGWLRMETPAKLKISMINHAN